MQRSKELEKFGQNLRAWRAHRKLSQEKLAEKVEISVAYVSCIERGIRNPPYTTVLALAKGVGASVAELVTSAPEAT